MAIHDIKNLGYRVARLIPPAIRSPIYRRIKDGKNWYSKTVGQWRGNAVAVYWYNEAINFGDLLTPALLKFYGFSPYLSIRPLKEQGKPNDLVVVGSVLTWLHPEFRGIILGSGAMDADVPKELPNALFLAVRGTLTKQLFRCPDSVILGDPGLLADRLFLPTISKRYRLGIVVHASEYDKRLFAGKFDEDANTKIIDPRRYPGDVLRDIAECEYIASSSLHGLIVADSFGIPCVRISLSEGLVLGGDFKFSDYYTSIGVPHEKLYVAEKVSSDRLISMTNTPSQETILQRKNDLHRLFSGLKAILVERN